MASEEIVVKSLSAGLREIGVFSGATILGTGEVALILDVAALSAMTQTLCPEQDSGMAAEDVTEAEPAPGWPAHGIAGRVSALAGSGVAGLTTEREGGSAMQQAGAGSGSGSIIGSKTGSISGSKTGSKTGSATDWKTGRPTGWSGR